MNILRDNRFWGVSIFGVASLGCTHFAIRLWREGDALNATSFTAGAILFFVWAVMVVFFGARTKKGRAPTRLSISPRPFGGGVELVSSESATPIEIARGKLQAAGIEAAVVGSHDTGVLPVLGGEAKVRLIVAQEDAPRAETLLRESGGESSPLDLESHHSERGVVDDREDNH